MRKSDELAQEVLKSAQKIKQAKDQKNRNIKIHGAIGISICMIICLSFAIPNSMQNMGNMSNTSQFAASMFANSNILGYIVMGTLSFVLGIAVTIFCFKIKSNMK